MKKRLKDLKKGDKFYIVETIAVPCKITVGGHTYIQEESTIERQCIWIENFESDIWKKIIEKYESNPNSYDPTLLIHYRADLYPDTMTLHGSDLNKSFIDLGTKKIYTDYVYYNACKLNNENYE